MTVSLRILAFFAGLGAPNARRAGEDEKVDREPARSLAALAGAAPAGAAAEVGRATGRRLNARPHQARAHLAPGDALRHGGLGWSDTFLRLLIPSGAARADRIGDESLAACALAVEIAELPDGERGRLHVLLDLGINRHLQTRVHDGRERGSDRSRGTTFVERDDGRADASLGQG